MKKILSICIPTRNRVYTLNQNIEYLINIIENLSLEKHIDIIISDNSTLKNFNKIIKPNKDFFKILHSEDEGHDLNIKKLIDKVTSDYIWFCQDHTKILKKSLQKIIKILKEKKNNLDFLFLSTKDKYILKRKFRKSPKFFSFKNIYLNTNLVNTEKFKKNYLSIIHEYNGSHLVFHYAIINLLYKDNNSNVFYITDKCSIYKYFNIDNEHFKMTWSKSLTNYINILNFSAKFYNKFLSKNIKVKYDVNKILKSFENSIPTIYRIIQLYKKNNDTDLNINKDFINHPTFNIYESFILNLIFKYKFNFVTYFIPKIILIDLYFLIFLPKQYIKRASKKIINSF